MKEPLKAIVKIVFLVTLVVTAIVLSFRTQSNVTTVISTKTVETDNVHLRRLSLKYDIHTGQNVRTVNGTIPEVFCQLG